MGSLRRNNNITTALVSDVAQLTTALPPAGTVVTSSNLAKGAVVVTDLGLRRLDNTAYGLLPTSAQVFIVQGKGANKPLMKSPVLTKGSLSFSVTKHKPAVQQVSSVGFDGTTGNLVVAPNTNYFIKIRKNDNDAANRSQPNSLFATFKTTATSTLEDLAFGLAKNGAKNFADEPANGYLKFEVVTNGTMAAGAAAATVTNGSKNVAVVAHALAVGDLVAIAGATYKVAALNGANAFVLNMPYQGATGTVAAGTAYATTFGKITAATSFGIRITGVVAPFNVNTFRDYYVNRFTVTYSDTAVKAKLVTGAQNGSGVWQQVAMDEYMTYGFEGQNEMLTTAPKMRDQEVKIPGVGAETALTSRYSAINISWTEDITGLVSKAGAKGSVLVYANLSNATTGVVTGSTAEEVATVLGITASTLNM